MKRSVKVLVVKSMRRYDVARPSVRVLVIKAVRKRIDVESIAWAFYVDGFAKVGSCQAQCEGASCDGSAKANSRQTCAHGDVKAKCIEEHCHMSWRTCDGCLSAVLSAEAQHHKS